MVGGVGEIDGLLGVKAFFFFFSFFFFVFLIYISLVVLSLSCLLVLAIGHYIPTPRTDTFLYQYYEYYGLYQIYNVDEISCNFN